MIVLSVVYTDSKLIGEITTDTYGAYCFECRCEMIMQRLAHAVFAVPPTDISASTTSVSFL